MNAPAVLELPLDDALLKVLSSESRREILRLLRERRMTGAELATRLDLGKPAVAEHLKKLQEAELIERFDDPERRWVYYNLSSRGRGILEPQRVRFYLVMAVAALGLMVGIALALGLVVLMQGNPAGAGAISPDGSALGTNAASGLGSPDVAASTPVGGQASKQPTSTSTSPSPPQTEVYQGPPRAPTPVGGTQAIAPSAQAMALLIDPQSVPAPPPTQTAPVPMVLVYRAQDIDAANHTVQVLLVPFNATALAAANLTEAVQNAAIVPDVGLVLVVPDGTPLPVTGNDTVTLTFSEPVADAQAANAPVGNATAPNGATWSSAPTSAAANSSSAGTTPAASPADTGTSAPTPTLSNAGNGAGVSSPSATATQAPNPSATMTAAPTTGSSPLDFAANQEVAGATVGVGPDAEPRSQPLGSATSKAAPIPLVALLAAALMVSIYLPNRRK